MADSATSIPAVAPPLDTAALPFAQAAALATTGGINAVNNASFLSAIAQSVAGNDLQALDTSPVSTADNSSVSDSLLSLNAPSLSLLNEIGSDPRSASITGDFSAQQMQAVGILLKDEQGLEEAAHLSSYIPLTSGATTVDLSLEAQSIAYGGSTVAPVNGLNPLAQITSTPLTPAQLAQAGAILAPLVNTPLTQPLLVQIQAQLTAATLNPLQISLSTLFLVMNYLAELQPAATHLTEADYSSAENENEEIVAPVPSLDGVAVEDSAIL